MPSRNAIALTALAATALALGASCNPAPDSGPASPLAPNTPLRFAVSIPPQAEFIRRIVGNRVAESPVQIDVFVGAGQDPHHFSATPKQVMSLGSAHAYFTIGMPFENSLVKKLSATVPNLRIENMAEGLEAAEAIAEGTEHGHDHAHAHGHAKEGEEEDENEDEETEEEGDHDGHHHGHDHSYDPHVWLSPPLIAGIAANIRDVLVELDPANASLYSKNFEDFERELEGIDEELAFTLEPCRGSAFFVYHPAFTHFAARYGLEQKAIEFEGKSPTPKQLLAVVDEARESGARVIFTQPQFDPASAQTVADAIDGTVESIDPLAEDVLANLKSIALTLYKASQTETSQ